MRNHERRLAALESASPDEVIDLADLRFCGVSFGEIYDRLSPEERDALRSSISAGVESEVREILNLGMERFNRGDEPFRFHRSTVRETYERLKREREEHGAA
jgi:hypothetical protein